VSDQPAHRWRLDSETDRLTDVLLCRPEHYEWIPTNAIARATLAAGAPLDRPALAAEWDEFEAALGEAEVTLHHLEPEPGLKYQVYTRDSSQTGPSGPMLTLLAMPQRRGEYAALLRFHEGRFAHLATAGTVEGGDVHLIRPGLAAIGFSGGRTERAGAEQMAGWLRVEGWEVRLVPFDDHFLHLDVIFSMAAEGLALTCREALPDDFLGWLEANRIRTLEVGYREAMADMACNVLALGDGRVLSPRHSARVNAALRAEGLTVLDPTLRLFASGGGSAHCMTMPLRRVRARGAGPAGG
jgi:N-dimethylarginine dimethylaminohydrolase